MKICILMGSPRKNGNTASLLKPFCERLADNGHDCETVWLYDKKISPCTACRACQKDWGGFNCRIHDDAYELFERVQACDVLVLATPIYSWYCTPPMKALMDRLVYGMNKYYGESKGPSLWEGKGLALLVTCGYPPEKGADLWEEGVRRYCKHSKLRYIGMLAEHDEGYQRRFMNDEKKWRVTKFAQDICGEQQSQFSR